MRAELRKVWKIVDRVKKKYQEKMEKEIRVAFVGCGKHATENIYPALKYASMNLIAVCAKHLENAERQALQFGAEAAYDDYEEMLDKEEIDALIVCVNPRLHYEISMVALKKNLPVFVEKPPAPGSEEAKEMLELSREVDKFLMVGFNKRFGPGYKEAKILIEKERIGRLSSIFIRAYVGATSGEETLLLDIGIHYIDLLRYFGGEIKDFHVRKKVYRGRTTIVISCEFENTAVGILQLSDGYSWSKPGEYIEILGEENLVILENAHRLIHHKPTIASPGEIPSDGEKSTIWIPNYSIPVKENHLIFLNGYVYELKHFRDIVTGRKGGISSIEDGYKALELIENISKR